MGGCVEYLGWCHTMGELCRIYLGLHHQLYEHLRRVPEFRRDPAQHCFEEKQRLYDDFRAAGGRTMRESCYEDYYDCLCPQYVPADEPGAQLRLQNLVKR